MYFDWTYIILVMPAVLFTMWASSNVKNTYARYSQHYNRRGITGAEAARRVLDANGLGHVAIERVSGELSDHYDPRTNIVRLSEGVYNSSSTAAVGVACHEAGHAIVGELLPGCDDVHLITIMPRGSSGGHTLLLPEKESDFTTRTQLLDFVAMALGGYAAEQLVMGEMSTGASSDLQRATDICRRMVMQYGMSDEMGPIFLGGDHSEVFLARDYGQQSRMFSESVAARIDAEVQQKMTAAFDRAKAILAENRDKLEGLTTLLMERETIDRAEFSAFMKGEPLPVAEAPKAEEQQPEQEETASAND